MIDNLNVVAHAIRLRINSKGGIISMQERVLKVLEFEKVKEQLLQHVASSLGREMAKSLFHQLILKKLSKHRKKRTKLPKCSE